MLHGEALLGVGVFYAFTAKQSRSIIPQMRGQREKHFTADICRRLSEFSFDTLRLSPKQLSETLGCDPSMVYRIRRGETLPDLAKLVDLWSFARAQGVPLNFEWLLTGQASLGMPELRSPAHSDALQCLNELPEGDIKVLLPLLKALRERKKA